MNNCFCTLFDSNYLDKGIALWKSIHRQCNIFKLYIFAFDDLCLDTLKKMNLENVCVISLDEFESEELRAVKKQRTSTEYCWTCTPFVIKYVLEHYKEDVCTYVDADLFFFDNPAKLLDELENDAADVGIVEHRFGKGYYQKKLLKVSGKYCVQFNTFYNNTNAMTILAWWANMCYNCCCGQYSNGNLGDQMYLNDWMTRFHNVHELKNQGGGVAPWNIYRYRLVSKENDKIKLFDRQKKEYFGLIFYHFHGVKYLENTKVDLNIYVKYGLPQRKLIYTLYSTYFRELEVIQKKLSKEFGIYLPAEYEPKELSLPDKKKLTQYIQMGIIECMVHLWDGVRFRIRHLFDIMKIPTIYKKGKTD